MYCWMLGGARRRRSLRSRNHLGLEVGAPCPHDLLHTGKVPVAETLCRNLARAFGCARVVFNDGPRLRQQAREAGEKYISDGELSRRLITQAKATPQRVWLGEVSSVVLQQALADLNTAYRDFFNSISGKRKGRALAPPRFRSRKDNRQAIRFTKNARLQGPRQPQAAAAEDRRPGRALVAGAALGPLVGDDRQGCGRSVFRIVRGHHRAGGDASDGRVRGGYRPGADALRRAVRRDESRGTEVPAPRGPQAQAVAAGPGPQAARRQQP